MSGCLKNIHFADGINVERNDKGDIVSICVIFPPILNSLSELIYFFQPPA